MNTNKYDINTSFQENNFVKFTPLNINREINTPNNLLFNKSVQYLQSASLKTKFTSSEELLHYFKINKLNKTINLQPLPIDNNKDIVNKSAFSQASYLKSLFNNVEMKKINIKNLNNLHLMNSLTDPFGKGKLSTQMTVSPLFPKEERKIENISESKLTLYLNSLIKFNKNLAKNQHIFYQFNKANTKSYKFLFDKTSKLLNSSFLAMGCLISKPIFKIVFTKNNLEFEHDIISSLNNNQSNQFTQKILIDLSYFIRKNQNKYLNNNIEINNNILHISHPDDPIENSSIVKVSQRNNILCKYNDKFQFLTDYLNSMFKSEVELELLRLHKVFYDSNILVQDIALKSYKFRFVKLVSRLFKRLHIQKLDYSNSSNQNIPFPSYLSGINIKLAGRTFRQRVIPRMTVKRAQKGSLTNVNVQFIDRARFTSKTRRGSYSFTITLGHVFN